MGTGAINPDMPTAQRNFWPDLPHTPDDARASIHIEDSFRFFAERKDQPLYDVVVIDLAWMQNMNATHLFSKEMYENIARNLHDDGVLAVWSEEGNPFSAVSLIMYRALREVFQHVVIDTTSGVAVFYASKTRGDLVNFLKPEAMQTNAWIAEIGMQAPVNRLDNLVMNRHKFSLFGDSNWERLFEKYALSEDDHSL
jgi:spermidine synthase